MTSTTGGAVPRGLAIRAVGYFAVRDFIPLYAVYALLFADHGLSDAAISSLFAIWSVTSFVAEIPSGAWADLVSRRLLLALSALLYAAAFALWTGLPGYPGFAGGFVLWGVSGALMSGTFEALFYDELTAIGASERYARLMGYAHAISMLAYLVASLLAAPLFRAGGYALVGWCSVGVALLHGAIALTLPAAPKAAAADDDLIGDASQAGVLRRYLATLRAGVAEAGRRGPVRRAVLGASLLIGVLALDEYFPLLAREQGVRTGDVPLVIALVAAGQALGTALTGRVAAWRSGRIALFLVSGAVALGAGGALRHAAGMAAIAFGYGVITNVIVVADARIQDAIEGPARATVLSVVGFGSEVCAVLVFAAFAGGSQTVRLGVMVAAAAGIVTLLAVTLPRWLPDSRGRADAPSAPKP